MTGPIQTSDLAFKAMVGAFTTADEEQRSVHRAVLAAKDQLNTQWGGEAAAVYQRAMDTWMSDFHQVRIAMQMQQDAMVEYARTTTTTDDDAVVAADGWAGLADGWTGP